MGKFRKKPWRTYSRRIRVSTTSRYIRYMCCSILALELAFFVREFYEGGGCLYQVTSAWETEALEEPQGGPGEQTGEGSGRAPGDFNIYGVRLRLKDGEIDFYKKEKLKSTN